MPHIKLLLVDVDGTLIDTSDLIIECFTHALETEHGIRPTHEDYKPILGKPLPEMFAHVGSRYGKTFTEENLETLRQHYFDHQKERIPSVRAFPGVHDFLKKIREAGIPIAAITSANNPKPRLEASGITDLLDLVISGSDVAQHKPHPEGIERALAHFAIAPKDALMIGDTSVDVEAGKNAGTRTIGVTYGQLGHDIAHHSPDHIIHSIDEALAILGV